ncbi:hypothetical protein [Streptomyces sp. NPDC059008]
MAAGECPDSLADVLADGPAGVRRPIRCRLRPGPLLREELAGT